MREARQRLVYEVVRRRSRGESIRGIARTLQIDRKTIKRILKNISMRRNTGDDVMTRDLPRPRAPRASKLDRYADYIRQQVAKYPDLRAQRLLEMLQEQGFDGGYTIVREHLNRVRPKPKRKPAKLVQTGPGKQAQVDWSPYRIEDGIKINAFSSILSYSRYQYIRFCHNTKQMTLFRQMRLSFEYHGGIADEYVFDSMPGVVDRWELNEPIINLRMLDFAAFYDFSIHIAPRNDGAYKGKVERPFRFLDTSFFNGRTLHSLEHANRELAIWLETRASPRKHGTTGRPPVIMLQEELPHLNPLPVHRWDDRDLAYRIVDGYGYARFEQNFYRAPDDYVGHRVYIRADEHTVELFDNTAQKLASHERQPSGMKQYCPPPNQRKRSRRIPISRLLTRFVAWSEHAHAFATQVRKHQRCAGVHLSRILQLQDDYALADILRAIEHANHYAAFDAKAVERIIQVRAKPRTLSDRLGRAARRKVRQDMARSPVKQRSVGSYGQLLASTGTPTEQEQEANDGKTRKTNAKTTARDDC